MVCCVSWLDTHRPLRVASGLPYWSAQHPRHRYSALLSDNLLLLLRLPRRESRERKPPCYPLAIPIFKERNLFGLICCTTTYEVYKTRFDLYRRYLPAELTASVRMTYLGSRREPAPAGGEMGREGRRLGTPGFCSEIRAEPWSLRHIVVRRVMNQKPVG
jgi:hypothetical protein